MQKDKLIALATERSTPYLVLEAEARVTSEYGEREIGPLLAQLRSLEKEINANYNLDSLHVFLSNTTKEIMRSPWPTPRNVVQIADTFAIKPLIKAINRTEEYLILLLSQSDVTLLHAVDEHIIETIVNDDFPFSRSAAHHRPLSDAKHADNVVREYLKSIDKAVVKVHNATRMNCVVVCTSDNYGRLMQVVEKPSIYFGNVHVNHSDAPTHEIAAEALRVVTAFQRQHRARAIEEMNEATGRGKALSNVAEIFRAAREGRGELVIVRDDYRQSVKMTGENSFDLIDDVTTPDAIDDISSEIAWEVIAKKGRALFISRDEDASLGPIELKVRF